MRFFLSALLLTNVVLADVNEQEFLTTDKPRLKENEMGIISEVDFIYMKPKIDNLFFAVSENEKVYAPDFDFSPGFKALIGFYFPKWTWDLTGRFTELNSHSHKSVSSPSFPLLWQNSLSTTPLFEKSSSFFNLNYNSIDIEVGKSILPTPLISMRIHGGIKNCMIKQKLKLIYKDSNLLATDPNLNYMQSKNILKTISNGTGVRLGFDSKWKLSSSWRLLANPSISFMLTSFDMYQNYYDTLHNFSTFETTSSNMKYKEHIWVVRPQAQIIFGLDYMHCFNSFTLNFYFAYEFDYFWEYNLNRRYHILANSYMNKGDLYFQGLNIALRLEF
jgi:hypothetical protein